MVCQGKSRRTKQPCTRQAKKGRKYCYLHGGNVPAGAAHPNFTHGSYSKHLPRDLATKYHESLTDPQLLEFRQDVALLQARLLHLLESGESYALWEAALAAFRTLETALKSQDTQRTFAALKELKSLLTQGKTDSRFWAEIYDLNESIGRTKEREHKRLVAMQQMISAEQFGALIIVITEAAKRTIKDPQSLSAFADELARLWNDTGH